MDEKARRRLLWILAIGVLMGALDVAIVSPALKPIGTHFGTDPRGLQWVFTVYILFNIVGTPLLAKLSDLLGRRSIYLVGVGLFALGSVIAGLSISFEMLLAGRAVQGFGAGGILPVAYAVIGDTFPPERRGRAIGSLGAIWGMAMVAGPLVGAVLLGFGWQWIFFVNLPIAIAVVVAGVDLLPKTRRPGPVRFDWAGIATLGVLLAALALGVSQIDSSNLGRSLTSSPVGLFLLVAVVLMPLFWWIEHRAVDPVVPPVLLGKRQLRLAYALNLGTGIGQASLVFIPTLAALLMGTGTQLSSAALLPAVVTTSAGSVVAGRLVDAIGSRFVVIAGGVLLTVGMVLMAVMVPNWVLFVVAAIILGAGLGGLVGAPLRYITLNEAEPQERGVAQAALGVFLNIGQLIGWALIGAVAASMGGGPVGFTTAYGAVGVVAVLIVLGGLLLRGLEEERTVLAMQKTTRQGPTRGQTGQGVMGDQR